MLLDVAVDTIAPASPARHHHRSLKASARHRSVAEVRHDGPGLGAPPLVYASS